MAGSNQRSRWDTALDRTARWSSRSVGSGTLDFGPSLFRRSSRGEELRSPERLELLWRFHNDGFQVAGLLSPAAEREYR